jgi:hypothetical protein
VTGYLNYILAKEHIADLRRAAERSRVGGGGAARRAPAFRPGLLTRAVSSATCLLLPHRCAEEVPK